MTRIIWLCLIGIIVLTTIGCKKDSNNNSSGNSFADGILITNRGAQFDPVGSISHFNRESGSFTNTIYQKVNADTLFGNIAAIQTHQSKAYIVMNDPDRIEVVNLRDFTWEKTIVGLENPKDILAVSLTKLYISQWGADGTSGSIQIYSLNTDDIVGSIPTGKGASAMVQVGNQVYVANSGGTLSDSTLAVINTQTDAVIDHIDVGINPTHLQVDRNNAIWSLSKGIIYSNQPNIDGKLSKIVSDQVVYQHDVAAGAANLAINADKDLLYYVMRASELESWTFSHDINATGFNTTPFLQRYFWGIAVDPETDNLWATDPMNFFIPGTVYQYNSSAQELESFTGGLVPEKFLFQ